MSLVANLYKSVPHSGSVSHSRIAQPGIVEQESEWERRRREEREAKEDSKRKAKESLLKGKERSYLRKNKLAINQMEFHKLFECREPSVLIYVFELQLFQFC